MDSQSKREIELSKHIEVSVVLAGARIAIYTHTCRLEKLEKLVDFNSSSELKIQLEFRVANSTRANNGYNSFS